MKRWGLLVVSVAVATTFLTLLEAPASYLLGSLIGALVVSLAAPGPAIPAYGGTLGQAIIGTSVGTLVTVALLTTLAGTGRSSPSPSWPRW